MKKAKDNGIFNKIGRDCNDLSEEFCNIYWPLYWDL